MFRGCAIIVVAILSTVYSYVLPELTIERLNSKGIQVSIPDDVGVQFFAFHANINDPITVSDQGTIAGEVTRKPWAFQEQNITLHPEDVLYYWIYVQVNGKSYTKIGVEQTPARKIVGKRNAAPCEPSVTTVRGILSECRERLVFEETFDQEILFLPRAAYNSSWTREIFFPTDPDYEFCAYRELPDSIEVKNSILRVSPRILDELYGDNATLYGRINLSEICTSTVPVECARRAIGYSILPPIISARLTTKDSFYFRYGRIEIRAKFPKGDWLYPELWLEPKYLTYGTGYMNGRVILGMSRGNERLTKISDPNYSQFGANLLEFGLRTGPNINVREDKSAKLKDLSSWTEDFHIYTTIWNEQGFSFKVDGEDVGRLNPPESGWLNSIASRKHFQSDTMAPYDKEFYITVGLGVGGIRAFPDGMMSGRHEKPWRNIEAKAMLHFLQAREKWLPTWKDRNGIINSQLEVDYIKVWTI